MRVEECALILKRPGVCAWLPCSKPLPPRRRNWCSTACANQYGDNHIWGMARKAAIVRDGGRCVKCTREVATIERAADGLLWVVSFDAEVNHIEPRRGAKMGQSSCRNHLDNLETLCHDDHARVTLAGSVSRAQVMEASDRKAGGRIARDTSTARCAVECPPESPPFVVTGIRAVRERSTEALP